MAPFHFLVDLLLDLVEWYVAGAFDHHLHIVFPGLRGEFAKDFQFGKLRFVARVCDAAGAQAVAEREANVVLFKNLADVFDVFIKKILLLVVLHPMCHQRAAAADDSGNAFAHERYVLAQHAGMDGHVVDALFGLLFDNFQHQAKREVLWPAHARDGFIDGHRADGNGRGFDDGFADVGDVAARREVHDRVCAIVHRVMQLL